MDDDLIPPAHLLMDGSVSEDEFRSVGEGFTRHYLIGRAGLQPTERVLDIGSGNGQKARVLARYLQPPGSYEGVDIVADAVRWCAERYRRFPHVRFTVADVHSTHYNPAGRFRANEYRLPYEDASFDLVFLSSVFTHMLLNDVRHYLTQVARVLRVGGRTVMTFFLLNGESSRRLAAGSESVHVPYVYGTEGSQVADPKTPETTVAHQEDAIRASCDHLGLSIAEISYGTWCGRRELVGALQDAIIAVKAE